MDKYTLLRLRDKLERIPHDVGEAIRGVKVELSLETTDERTHKGNTKNGDKGGTT